MISIKGSGEKIILSNDITHWLHECNRFLFLAKVHLDNHPDVDPICDGDPVSYLETIENLSKVQTNDSGLSQKLLIQDPKKGSALVSLARDIHITIKVPSDDISDLKSTFISIQQKEWKNLDPDKIENAQEILYKIFHSVKESLSDVH
jgi:hypothetical protein